MGGYDKGFWEGKGACCGGAVFFFKRGLKPPNRIIKKGLGPMLKKPGGPEGAKFYSFVV